MNQGDIDKILQQLHNLCHLIEPLYQPIVEPVELSGTWIIVIWVPGGHGRPYKVSKDVFVKDKGNKRYYIRKFSSTVIASHDEEKELFYVSSDIPFDDRPNLVAEVVANYPFAAVEEILSNAVYHRSYQLAEPITALQSRSLSWMRLVGISR